MIDILDVTLRDGGHAVSFDWPKDFARRYYSIVSEIPEVKLIELGYWKQKSKSTNMFYNLDFDSICDITKSSGKKNVAIMVDYHYCSHNLEDYPNNHQDEIAMIRICSRKKDIDKALEFAKSLKEKTKLIISLNVFNISNYSHQDILDICEKLYNSGLDYVYFADTHGTLNLREETKRFQQYVHLLYSGGMKVGMHLHDHRGMAYFNNSQLENIGFIGTDASLRGMGKGAGNLKLEQIISKKFLPELLQIAYDYKELLTMNPSPYYLISSLHSITDYYALNAEEKNMSLLEFDLFCKSISGQDKDVYNASLFQSFDRDKK